MILCGDDLPERVSTLEEALVLLSVGSSWGQVLPALEHVARTVSLERRIKALEAMLLICAGLVPTCTGKALSERVAELERHVAGVIGPRTREQLGMTRTGGI
jgi:hypothetical protein